MMAICKMNKDTDMVNIVGKTMINIKVIGKII